MCHLGGKKVTFITNHYLLHNRCTIIVFMLLWTDADSPLQDLMTFTTKAEEDRLMASSKQVQDAQRRSIQVLH